MNQKHFLEKDRSPKLSTAERRAALVTSDPRWASVTKRDAAVDGAFYFAVTTTGVYCRPSCAARPARPEHVEFFTARADAERAGYRPCKRCRPDEPPLAERYASQIAQLCRRIEAAHEVPSLAKLAEEVGWSVFHLHRVFKAVTGVTPRAYASAHRATRLREELSVSPTVTDAIYSAGYASSGRFYATSNARLGMTPTTFRAAGTHTEICFTVGTCSLGAILVATTMRGVCAILLGDRGESLVHDLERRFCRAKLVRGDAAFERFAAEVIAQVEQPRAGVTLPLDIRGTAFQQRVWDALRRIPVGTTASYAEIAAAIGAPTSARAVARACAANALAVVIPCHRVVRSDGDLSGYRWGVERKRILLAREGRA